LTKKNHNKRHNQVATNECSKKEMPGTEASGKNPPPPRANVLLKLTGRINTPQKRRPHQENRETIAKETQ